MTEVTAVLVYSQNSLSFNAVTLHKQLKLFILGVYGNEKFHKVT